MELGFPAHQSWDVTYKVSHFVGWLFYTMTNSRATISWSFVLVFSKSANPDKWSDFSLCFICFRGYDSSRSMKGQIHRWWHELSEEIGFEEINKYLLNNSLKYLMFKNLQNTITTVFFVLKKNQISKFNHMIFSRVLEYFELYHKLSISNFITKKIWESKFRDLNKR